MNFFDFTSLNDPIPHGLTLIERFAPILILVIILTLLIKNKEVLKNNRYEKQTRIILALLMMFGELSYMSWNLYHSQYGRVDFFSTLPFHLCSYAIWGLMYALISKNRTVYNYVFVFGIISVLALLFPNVNHGVNSFRYYQLYFSHSMILVSIVYMYEAYDFYPKLLDLKKSFIFLQIIIVLSILVNILTGSDFLFIGPGNKPIDFAWEWPWHMIEYEIVMFLFYTGTYFYIKKLLQKQMD